jgi:hypothetical protein
LFSAAQVVRVALSSLKNLLSAPGLQVGQDMVEAGLPKVVHQRLLQVSHLAYSSLTLDFWQGG